MKIDFTLVVQGINFGIGYLIIRKLLLAPAVKEIEADLSHKRTLNHKIETITLANDASDERMKKSWQEFREQVQKKIPVFGTVQRASVEAPELIIQKVDSEYAKYLIGIAAKEIVERVENVRS